MLDRSDESFFQRAVIGPTRKEFVDDGVVNFRLAVRRFVNWPVLPLRPVVKDFQDVVESFVITDLAGRPPLRQRQVRPDKLRELRLAQPHGNHVVNGLFLFFRCSFQVCFMSYDDFSAILNLN